MTLRRLFTFLFLLFASCAPVSLPVSGTSETGIAGRVTDRDGAPASGAQVFAYRSSRGGLRGPADFAAQTGEDGTYFLDLVEGEYYLVARRRREGGDAGPPRPGDSWSLYPGNPVKVEPGRTSRADFHMQTVTRPALMKEGTLAGGDTGFRGRLVDPEGRPVAGAFFLGYRSRDFQRMPEVVSPAADEEGRFVLYVPSAGTWCMAARAGYRGQPRPGELYGTLGDGEGACRGVVKGEVVDLGTVVLRPYRR